MNTVNLSRRKFLKSSAIVSGGLVVGFSMSGCAVSNPPVVAMPGGLVLGVAEAFGSDIFGDQYKDVVAFSLLVLVLLFRPALQHPASDRRGGY